MATTIPELIDSVNELINATNIKKNLLDEKADLAVSSAESVQEDVVYIRDTMPVVIDKAGLVEDALVEVRATAADVSDKHEEVLLASGIAEDAAGRAKADADAAQAAAGMAVNGLFNYDVPDSDSLLVLTGMTDGQTALVRSNEHQWKYEGGAWVDKGPSIVADKTTKSQVAEMIYSSVLDLEPEALTVVSGKYLNYYDGAISENSAYHYAFFAHTNGDLWFASATVLGTGIALAVYYGANDSYLGYEHRGPSGVADVYVDERLNPPLGTVKIGICGRTTSGLTVKKGVPVDVATRLADAVYTAGEAVNLAEVVAEVVSADETVPVMGSNHEGYYPLLMNGEQNANANYQYTDFPYSGGKVYASALVVGASVALAYFYNASGAYLGYEVQGNAASTHYNNYLLSPPTGTAKIRICSRLLPVDVKPVLNVVQKGILPVAEMLSDQSADIATIKASIASGWKGKTIDVLGDSNVGQNKWQPLVGTSLGCAFLNHGVGGSRISKPDSNPSTQISMCDDVRINALSSTADAYAVMGGTNDWAQGAPLGTINDSVDTTFYGALKIIIQKMITRFPTKPIFLITPFYTRYSAPRIGWSTYDTNNQGLSVHDYADAVRQVGRKYAIPVIDNYAECGWGEWNYSEFLLQEAATNPAGGFSFIHLNADTGPARIANRVVRRLSALAPL